MCNAWNHLPGCRCGWGGEGHLGKRSVNLPSPTYFFSQRIESFTVPNVRCQFCGNSIFYYQNIHGSKVFFDSLGPPWPKHECLKTLTPAAQVLDWEPFLRPYSDATPDGNGVVKIEGYLGKNRLSLFAKSKSPDFSASFNFRSGCVFIKRINLGVYDFEYIDDASGEIRSVRAYRNRRAALNAHRRKPRKTRSLRQATG